MFKSRIIRGPPAVLQTTFRSIKCLATLALLTGVTLAAAPALSWETVNQPDPLDDRVTSYVFMRSDSTSACSDQRPAMVLICSETLPSSLMLAEACEPLTDADKPFAPFEVTIRVDTSPAVKVTMQRNLFVPDFIGDGAVGRSARDAPTPEFGDLIQDYLDSQKMAVRYITAEGRVETLVFSTAGMREAVLSSGSVCGAEMFQ